MRRACLAFALIGVATVGAAPGGAESPFPVGPPNQPATCGDFSSWVERAVRAQLARVVAGRATRSPFCPTTRGRMLATVPAVSRESSVQARDHERNTSRSLASEERRTAPAVGAAQVLAMQLLAGTPPRGRSSSERCRCRGHCCSPSPAVRLSSRRRRAEGVAQSILARRRE